jgi:hypothetical protein
MSSLLRRKKDSNLGTFSIGRSTRSTFDFANDMINFEKKLEQVKVAPNKNKLLENNIKDNSLSCPSNDLPDLFDTEVLPLLKKMGDKQMKSKVLINTNVAIDDDFWKTFFIFFPFVFLILYKIFNLF